MSSHVKVVMNDEDSTKLLSTKQTIYQSRVGSLLYLLKNSLDEEKKLSKKNIDKFVNDLPLSQYLKKEFNLTPIRWKIWSSGSISRGKTKLSLNKLGKDNKSNSITIGIDKIIKKNTLFGIAITNNKDNTDVSNIGSKVKSKEKIYHFILVGIVINPSSTLISLLLP